MANMKLTGGLLVALLGATAVVGCGDDGDETDGNGGKSSGGKSNGGSAGKSGDTGGSAGSSGSAGATNSGGSGQAGENSAGGTDGGGTNQGGMAGNGDDQGGEAGSGGSPELPLTAVTELKSKVFTEASDLRGLFFTAGGKLYASGHLGTSATTTDKRIVVGRFTADGDADTTFGTNGFVTVNVVPQVIDPNDATKFLNDGNEESLGIVELTNGDLVVQVNIRDENGKGMDVGLLRLDSSGAPVTTFGTGGLVRLTFGWAPADDASFPAAGTLTAPSDTSWGIELDPSSPTTQKIVVFGFGSAPLGSKTTGANGVQRTDNDRYIARVLASDGSIDPAFNGGKVFSFNSGDIFSDGGRRGIVEQDGAIVSAGYTNYGTGLGNHILLIRLQPNGTLDTNFGFGIVNRGVLRTNPFVSDGGVAECYNVTRQSSGRYVTTGYGSATGDGIASSYGYATTTGPDLISVGIAADGKAIDEAFGNLGTFVAQSEEAGLAATEDRGRDVLALPDNQLVYAGRYGTDPAIYVVAPDGSFDPANGVGKLIRYTPLSGTTSHFFRVKASPDFKRVAASTSNHADGALLAVLKVGE